MINEDPNMGRKQIFNELPIPSKVEEKGIFKLIYKGVFVAVKLLLDIRLNLVKISEGKKIQTVANSPVKSKNVNKAPTKVDNPIKGLENIKVEDKPVAKLTEGKTKTNTKEFKDSPPPIKPPDGER